MHMRCEINAWYVEEINFGILDSLCLSADADNLLKSSRE